MAMTIRGKSYEIKDIFSDQFEFNIPRYQRPYAWTTDEAGELLGDLLGYLKDYDTDINKMPEYFLGSIVLIKRENTPQADVVDGQQRLTTLTILLAILREQLTDDKARRDLTKYLYAESDSLLGTANRYRLTLREKEFFQKYVQEEKGIKNLIAIEPASLKGSAGNIRANAAFLWSRVSELPQKRQLALTQFILQRCALVAVSSDDLQSAYRIFSILNVRGLPLSHSDILKSDIVGGIQLESEQERYTSKWEEAEKKLGRDGFGDLFAHIRMVYRKAKLRETVLKEVRTHVIEANKIKPKQFVDEVLLLFADTYEIVTKSCFESTTNASDINTILNWLNRIDNSDWIPPAILFIKNHKDDSSAVLRFLSDLERLAASMFIRRIGITKRIERYGKLLTVMTNGNNLYEVGSPLQLTPQEKESTVTGLNGPIYDTQKVAKYVLLRLDSALAGEGARYDYPVISIEHVLPQTPPKDSHWLVDFSNKEQRIALTNQIGNLVLLSRRKNSSAQNYDLEKKKAIYFTPKGDGVSPFVLTTQVIREDRWTPDVVLRRQSELISKLKTVWQLG